jgi:phage terminase large subunit
MCQKYWWTRWFFWRKELVNLRRTTLNTYYKFLDDYNIPEANRGKLNWQDNTIRFANGAEILLLDLAYQPSDPLYTRFGSLELTGWFIDESNEVDAQCITILNTRIWRQKNSDLWIKPKLLETFNPDKWHVYSRYYKPYVSKTLPEYRQFIPALATDNPHIDQNYIDQLKKADEITKQRLLYGNFDYDDAAWKLFRYDEILDLFDSNIEKNNTRFISCDVARLGKDNTVISLWEWLECWDIIQKNWLTTDQTVKIIKDLEKEYWVQRNNIIIDTDWVWWWVADQLRGCINFMNNWRPFDDWQLRNFANLKAQCYFKFKELAEKRKIRIFADWAIKDELSQELSNIQLKNEFTDQKIQLESKEDMKKRLWRSPDIADSLMMRMYYEVCWIWDDVKSEIVNIDIWNFLLW